MLLSGFQSLIFDYGCYRRKFGTAAQKKDEGKQAFLPFSQSSSVSILRTWFYFQSVIDLFFSFPSSSSLASLVFRLRTPFVAHSPSVSFMSRQHWNPPFAMVVVTRHIVEDLGGINTRTVPSLWRKDTLLLGDLQ